MTLESVVFIAPITTATVTRWMRRSDMAGYAVPGRSGRVHGSVRTVTKRAPHASNGHVCAFEIRVQPWGFVQRIPNGSYY